jgi:glucose-6-phosphate isomerase
MRAALGDDRAAVQETWDRLAEARVVSRIWAHDHTLWDPEPNEISNRLGWLRLAWEMEEHVPRLEAFVEEVREAGYTHALLLGMGGSSMAPQVFRATFGTAEGYPDLQALDSTDPEAVLAYADRLEPERTLFIVSTKSGSTVETRSLFKYFYNWVLEAVGAERAGEHFVAITDPGSALEEMAEERGFRAVFHGDPEVGGRYSALSYFGLVPAALIGVDLERLLKRAQAMMTECRLEKPPHDNPAARLGAILGTFWELGRDKVTFAISPAVAEFGPWVEQLIAESLGKQGQGILPVVGEPLGPPEVYGDDRLFVHLALAGDESHDAALATLEAAGYPLVRLDLGDVYDVASQMVLWEMAIAVTGHLMGINPFNQPNVEAAKVLAREMVRRYQEQGALPEGESEPLAAEALVAFLAQAEAGDYVALQAFVPPDDETDRLLERLRVELRDRLHLATTTGYGPRFLHSIGQLYKGDAGNGLFVQFTAAHDRDAAIPAEAGADESIITFQVLERAQALGDYQAMRDVDRRVIHFHLSEDVAGDLRRLMEGLE